LSQNQTHIDISHNNSHIIGTPGIVSQIDSEHEPSNQEVLDNLVTYNGLYDPDS